MYAKITMDGTPQGTRVVDAATGEILQGVFDVEVRHRVREVPQVTIRQYFPTMKYTGPVTVEFFCMCCGQKIPEVKDAKG